MHSSKQKMGNDESAPLEFCRHSGPASTALPSAKPNGYRCPPDTDSPHPAFGRTIRVLRANGGSSESWSHPAPARGPDRCRQSGAAPVIHTARLPPGIRQRKPLLQKVNPQHYLKSHRLAAHLALRVVRRDQRQQLAPPRHHRIHLFKKLFPPRLLRVTLEICLMGQCHLPHV